MLIDDLIATSQTPAGLYKKVLCLGGRVAFTAHYVDSAGEQEAIQQCRNAYVEIVGQITTNLGRSPSDKELVRGVSHVDTQRVSEQLAQKSAWQAMLETKKETVDPIDNAIVQRKRQLKGEQDSRLAMLLDLKDKKEAADAEKIEHDAKLSDPRRIAAMEDASAVALAVVFDPTATAQEVRQAEWMERLARVGDPLIYQNLRRQHQKAEAEKRKATVSPLQAKAATLAGEITRLEQPFTLPASTTEFCPGESTALPDGLHLSQ